jgi:hypothetical protein
VTTLTVDITGDPSGAVNAFNDVGQAAKNAGSDIAGAGTDAATAATKFDRTAGAAGAMDDKFSKATGAMGALAAGFEFLGADKAAAGLEAAAMATDGLSGAGQALTLVMELETVAKIKNRVATLAKAAADKAATVAAKAMRIATLLMNAALAANPVGAVVALIVLLVAGLILAYKKSDAFRAIVDKMGEIAVKAFQSIGDAVGPMKDLVVKGFQAIVDPIQKVIDKIRELIDWIKGIDFPSIPDLNPFSRSGGAGTVTGGTGVTSRATGGGGWVQNITIVGATDPVAVGRQVRNLTYRFDRLLGVQPT